MVAGMSLWEDENPPSLPFEGLPFQRRPREVTNNLFLALRVPERVALLMHDSAARYAVGRTKKRAHRADLLHMTLLFLGDYSTQPWRRVETIRRLCSGIRHCPIPVTLDRGAVFGSGRDLVVVPRQTNPPLMDFARGLKQTFRHYGLLPPGVSNFSPHVTVIYGCGEIEPIPVEQSYGWNADRFVLIYSHHGQARHEELGSWEFQPDSIPHFPIREQFRLSV